MKESRNFREFEAANARKYNVGDLKGLFEERATKLGEMRGILDKATKDKRALSTEEERTWDLLDNEVTALNEVIHPLEQQARTIAAEAGRQAMGVYGGGSEEWIDARTGRSISVLSKGQRFADTLDREERNLSLARYIQATVTGDWRNAEGEQRAMSSAAGSAGVTVPFSLLASILDLARDKSVLMNAGVKAVVMDSNNLTIAKVTSDPAFQYKAENDLFVSSDIGFGKVELKAHTLGTVVTMSRELVHDAPNAVEKIMEVMGSAIANEIDRVGMFGTGTGQPKGLMNQAIQEVAVNGPLIDYGQFVNAWVKILQANGQPNAYIVSAREAGKLEQLVAGADGQYLKAPDAIAKLTRHISSKVPTNLVSGTRTADSVSFLGDFAQAMFGVRQGFLLETTTTGGDETFERHQLKLKLTWRGDFAVAQENHFTKLTGITA